MAILQRFNDIIQSNINALLDKLEDPAKMVDQYIINVSEDLAEVKKETATVLAEEARNKKLLDENLENIEKYNKLAEKAVLAGNDEDAVKFLAEVSKLEGLTADLQQTYDISKANSEKMKQLHDKLANDLADLKQRKSAVKAKVAAAEAMEKVNKYSEAKDKYGRGVGAFARMEEKADRMLAEQEAMNTLNAGPDDSIENLEAKYGAGSDNDVNDRLAALKAKLGK